MQETLVVVPGKVIPWHRPENSYHGGRRKAKADKDYQQIIGFCYKAQKGVNYGTEALSVTIDVFRKCPKSIKEPDRDIHTPDADNIAKNVLDGLQGIAFANDAQVVELHVKKHDRKKRSEYLTIKIQTIEGNF